MINANIEVEDLVRDYPQLIPFLTEKGIICIQCGAPIWGTLGEVIERVGLSVDEIVDSLNRLLDEQDAAK